MSRPSLLLLTVALAPLAGAQTLSLTPVATIDLDSTANPANPEYIGTNPSGVAWDGVDLYLSGYNNGNQPNDCSLVKLSDALGAQSFGTAFGAQPATPSFRGYIGIDLAGGLLVAAYDPGGIDPDGLTGWDSNGNGLWSRSARGSTGPGVDPGFPGGNPALGTGAGWTTFGSGRRALQDAVTGADIWDASSGMVLDANQGTFWRDMDFDDATGDVWLREGNNVIHAVRTADNATGVISVPFDPPDSDFVAGQNLAFLDTFFGDFVIYNDRFLTTALQDFFTVVQVIEPDGTAVTVDWGGFAPPMSAAWYDFAWDAASQTLVICDFTNRDAYVFALAQDVGTNYCATFPNSTGSSAVIAGQGSVVASDNALTLTASQLPLNQFGYFLTSQSQAFLPNPGGSQGNLCLGQPIGRFNSNVLNSGPDGEFSATIDLTAMPLNPAVAVQAGETWNFQAWYRDLNPMPTSNFTDGLEVAYQ